MCKHVYELEAKNKPAEILIRKAPSNNFMLMINKLKLIELTIQDSLFV